MARGAAHYETVTRRDLSPRQREVLELIAAGKTNGEIAERLGISLDGAKWHVSEILGKLGVETREDAAAWWQSRRGAGARVGSWARGLAPLWTWKVACAAAAGSAVVGLVLYLGRGDERPDALAACTADNVVLEVVEARGPDENVLFAVTARSRERPCHVAATVTALITNSAGVPVSGGGASPVAHDLFAHRETIAYATWSDLCTGEDDRLRLEAALLRGSASPWLANSVFVVQRPPCRSPLAEPIRPLVPQTIQVIPAALSSFLPDLGPDPLQAIACYPTEPNSKWQRPCAVADRIQPGLNAGNVDAILESVESTEFTCPEPGSGGIGGPWILCAGAPTGEVRSGVPVVFHGSAGDVLSLSQLRTQLEAMVQSAKNGQLYATRVASVACFDAACHEFALGIANDGSPAAAYLVYLFDEAVPKLVSVGFAGDVALEIRRGGTVRVGGPMEFVPLIPPY